MDATYLDHNASSPFPRDLLTELRELLAAGAGNPASPHQVGRAGKSLLIRATSAAARFVDCDPSDVFWTSGASEANSWVFHSVAEAARKSGRSARVIISSQEHASTWKAAGSALAIGAVVRQIPTLECGRVDTDALRELLESGERWDLVAVLHSNNETGVLQPAEEIAELCRNARAPLFLDCVQSLAKVPISVRELGAAFASFSGHKLGAPKGVGFLVARDGARALSALVHGGARGCLRGGTENVLGIALLGRILESVARGAPVFPPRLEAWRDEFEREVKRRVQGARIHGESAPRLPNTSYVGFEGIDGNGPLIALDLAGICASSGSACSSGSPEPSRVLRAMGCGLAMARSSIRFSSGRDTRWEDYERVLDVLPGVIQRARSTA